MNRPAGSYPYFDEQFALMAHRGGYLDEDDAPRENSLYAFGRAVEAGYRYLETDVHATSDGHLVASGIGMSAQCSQVQPQPKLGLPSWNTIQ